jgi:hypothetical protein
LNITKTVALRVKAISLTAAWTVIGSGSGRTIMRLGHFRNGEQVGEWITYDQQGQVYKVTNMDKK